MQVLFFYCLFFTKINCFDDKGPFVLADVDLITTFSVKWSFGKMDLNGVVR